MLRQCRLPMEDERRRILQAYHEAPQRSWLCVYSRCTCLSSRPLRPFGFRESASQLYHSTLSTRLDHSKSNSEIFNNGATVPRNRSNEIHCLSQLGGGQDLDFGGDYLQQGKCSKPSCDLANQDPSEKMLQLSQILQNSHRSVLWQYYPASCCPGRTT